MIRFIIFVILILSGIVFIKNYAIKLTSECTDNKYEMIKKVEVKDKNKNNYKYERLIKIKSISCRNDAIRLENKFNEMDGIWAKVNLYNNSIDILMKEEIDEPIIKKIITDEGYIVTKII
ncbi:heavy metal-associated domain-containing protein [uncultured Anaerofustis sp.]|uniref:heavy-metal-associated domain-containing protein n=1 Tax=uncultured Anaerofustis sp. TaxID=904996 RepID=UPI002600A976|nr:heavy metal-associated domain-containing protein [uncultured Anaerofustis sp.]